MRAGSTVRVTVRYFAAARAAAGVEDESIELAEEATVADLIDALHGRSLQLSKILGRCSYLCDGVAVRDVQTALGDSSTFDVLPPFAGG